MAKEKMASSKRSDSGMELSALFSVDKEMIEGNGEDCLYYQYDGNGFIIAALDGCGGSGSKKYEIFSGKTGAYIASRAVAGALKTWFDDKADVSAMKDYIDSAMRVCKSFDAVNGGKRMIGSLGKDFPTTAAVISGSISDTIDITVSWAGDSRCYLLGKKGLCQLTEDDLDGQDAMSNLLNDGVMTNVISASKPFELHTKKLELHEPCLLLCATDGCFGYLASPMEFEHLLVEAIVHSNSIESMKLCLDDSFAKVAGDDYTLVAAAFGYYDFEDIGRSFTKRLELLEKEYIGRDVEATELWERYKHDYSMYL